MVRLTPERAMARPRHIQLRCSRWCLLRMSRADGGPCRRGGQAAFSKKEMNRLEDAFGAWELKTDPDSDEHGESPLRLRYECDCPAEHPCDRQALSKWSASRSCSALWATP